MLACCRNPLSYPGERNNALVTLVAALHICFLVLEMFLWTKPLGLKTFRNTPEKAADSAVLAANQGLDNGLLAAGLVRGLIVAGVYGAATVSRRILSVQAVRRGRVDFALAGVKVGISPAMAAP